MRRCVVRSFWLCWLSFSLPPWSDVSAHCVSRDDHVSNAWIHCATTGVFRSSHEYGQQWHTSLSLFVGFLFVIVRKIWILLTLCLPCRLPSPSLFIVRRTRIAHLQVCAMLWRPATSRDWVVGNICCESWLLVPLFLDLSNDRWRSMCPLYILKQCAVDVLISCSMAFCSRRGIKYSPFVWNCGHLLHFVVHFHTLGLHHECQISWCKDNSCALLFSCIDVTCIKPNFTYMTNVKLAFAFHIFVHSMWMARSSVHSFFPAFHFSGTTAKFVGWFGALVYLWMVVMWHSRCHVRSKHCLQILCAFVFCCVCGTDVIS